MTRRLEGRRTVVTGASRGTAERVASEGSAVALVARTLDEHSTLPGSLPALWLCDCGPDHTGNIESSIDLLEREEMTIMNLQGTAPHPNGIRR
jgi:NAD(P)-dependent dehydrogenase (short-subunit alcohol dehydrogenase family)